MTPTATIAQNTTRGQRMLRQLGFPPALRAVIAGEVGSQFLRMRDFYGGTEDQDLWAVAIATAWRTRETMPTAGGGLLRLRVRWALRELVRQEARAHGLSQPHRRKGWVPTPLSKDARVAYATHAARVRWARKAIEAAA